jgi:hypothetical protein
VVVLLIAFIAIAAPAAVARRLTAAMLPAGADLAYASSLIRYVAIAVAAGTIALITWWALAPRFRVTDLGRWALASTVALFLAAAVSMWWYVDDDAGISFTFARNLADGHGLIFNAGEPPIEGYSNPLWVFALAGARLVGVDIVTAAKMLGLVFGVMCLLVMWPIVRNEHPIAWLALPLAAVNASAVVWTSSGLENALHAFLLTTVIWLLPTAERAQSQQPDDRRRGRSLWLLIMVLAALVLCRPEGAAFALAVATYLAVRAWRGKNSLRSAILTLAVPLACLAALIVFRQLYFGDPLPNTYYAKASNANPFRLLNPASGGWKYVAEAAVGCGWTIGLLPMMVLIAAPKRWSPFIPAALLVIAAQLFFVVSVGGDWMREFRFLAPIVPAVSLLIGIGLARVAEALRTAGIATARATVALCILVAAFIICPQLHRLIAFAHHPTTPMPTVAAIGNYFKMLGQRAGVEDPTLLHHDAGGTSFVAGIRLIDLAGLCDRTIAHHWQDRERMRKYLFEERRPHFIYSGPYFAQRFGLEDFQEFHRDYVPLPPPPDPALDGYIRRVRRDLYPKLFGDSPPSHGP